MCLSKSGTGILYILFVSFLVGQDFFVGKEKSTIIKFYSDAPLEKIEATNNSAIPVVNMKTGEIFVKVKMRDFHFANKLMEEHFNEEYVESEKYPYATFKGKLDTLISFEDGREIEVSVTGKMTIHGVTRDIKVKGTVKKDGNEYIIHSVFRLKPADYNIEIPKILILKIAEEVEVTFHSVIVPYSKK